MRIDVALNERVFVHTDGRPTEYLGPGVHRLFRPFAKVEAVRFDTDAIVANLRPEQAALVPESDLRVLSLEAHERALISRGGRPVKWLGTGQHLIWSTDRRMVRKDYDRVEWVPNVTVQVLDTSPLVADVLRDDVRALVPGSDYVEVTAPEGAVAIRYVDGKLEAVLGAGRHASWTTTRKVTFAVIDQRERLLNVAGQDVMTRDRVTLRLNLAAVYRVTDAARLAKVARDADEVLYLAVQLAAREAVSGRTLDELLAGREVVAAAIAPEVVAKAQALGLEVVSFGVKDLVLPGDMKTLLNKVIEAQKEAEANVILRREETAAVRSMAQTAKILGENPLLLRLKEIEAYKDLASKVGKVNLVLGDGAVGKMLKLE